jgi:Uma2 family endonuclease
MSRVSSPHIRFTVDEVERLAGANVLGSRRVELLNGRIYRIAPQATPHMAAITKASLTLGKHVPANEWLITQGTLRLDRFNAPDPDVLWVPYPIGTPAHLWPQPVLLIEVSDTTYRKDSGVKLRTYAFHGVQDYWIENLRENRIEVYRRPENPTGRVKDCRYASIEHFTRGRSISLLARSRVMIAVDDLLPSP